MDRYHSFEIIISILIFLTVVGFLLYGVISIVFGATKPSNQVPAIHRLFLEANIPPCYVQTRELGMMTVTAYSSTPEETDDTPFITASGRMVSEYVIACPRAIM